MNPEQEPDEWSIVGIDEDEDDQEVLRRSPEDTYYLEKMRVFEETFGIDKL